MSYDWMNPLNKLKLRGAINEKAPQVVFSNGQTFDLTYNGPNVKVTPHVTIEFPNPFVPMGIFEIRMVNDVGWLDE